MSETTQKNSYLANFILDTRNYTDPVENLIAHLKEVIGAVEGEVKDVKELGQKEFARVTDRRFPAGIYVQITFDGPASAPEALQERVRLDRTVNRLMVQAV